MNILNLTEASWQKLEEIKTLVPEVEEDFLVETALSLTLVLYQKVSEGAVIQVKSPEGKVEELRFKVKKSSKRKS
jgi:hypothetical protein